METPVFNKRKLPKLMACMTKNSLENLRNRAVFSVHIMDYKGIRRTKLALHECIILELKEAGFNESSTYLKDLIYDNIQLLEHDDIGIVVDLRKKDEYLEHIGRELQHAEKEKDKKNTKKEALILLDLALYYAEKGKGILWLAEKFFLATIAVSSQYMLDGGRQKNCCRYYYAKFLLDKFPDADVDEPFSILTEVRDASIGKTWPLVEPDDKESGDHADEKDKEDPLLLFVATAEELHGVLLAKARAIRPEDPSKAERLCRLAERRAIDAKASGKTAEAVIEIGICQLMMNSLNNAQKTFDRAFRIHTKNNNIAGLCEVRMHLAAVMQKLGDYDNAARLLTEMGGLAMDHGLRRHLGRALHLLGELHLRREKPELGTHHLQEAFFCFMGYSWQSLNGVDTLDFVAQKSPMMNVGKSHLEIVCQKSSVFKYVEEAEQSRVMTGISAGQEYMASYFDLIREARICGVAKIKTIEWKLSRAGWWIKRQHHDFWPCLCPQHNRTPLDILRMKLALAQNGNLSEEDESLTRADTLTDIQVLRSTSKPFALSSVKAVG